VIVVVPVRRKERRQIELVTDQLVVAGAAVHVVVAPLAADRVVARPAVDAVDAGAADDHVVPGVALMCPAPTTVAGTSSPGGPQIGVSCADALVKSETENSSANAPSTNRVRFMNLPLS